MNSNFFILLFIVLQSICIVSKETVTDDSIRKVLDDKLMKHPASGKADSSAPKMIAFRYKDVLLTDIIQEIASAMEINVLLPQGSQTVQTKVTYEVPRLLTLAEAWKELNRLMDLLGYTWVKEGSIYTLFKITPDIKREPLAFYSNPSPSELPNTNDVIQVIIYFSNLKVSDAASPIVAILAPPTGMLSSTADIKTEPKTNSVIITDRASSIKAALKILRQLDREGIPDAIEVVPLYYTQASYVEDIFKNKLFTGQQTQPGATPREQGAQQASYFLPNTRVFALERSNSMVIMGSVKAIRVVKDFLVKYIDKPLESGESILHLYDLQYLNAEDYAGVLQKLVNPASSDQTTAKAVGPRRDFQDVIIEPERSRITEALNPTLSGQNQAITQPVSQGIQQAGNRLVIAARKSDWLRIEKIIKDMDKPQPQVAIEVLVVDLVLTNQRLLGTQTRNRGFNDSISKNVNFQSALLGEPVLTPAPTDDNNIFNYGTQNFTANALAANLLRFNNDGNNLNLANQSTPGSTIISFNDPNNSGIWSVIQILNRYANTHILAQPFLIATDNKQSTISFGQSRYLFGGATSDGGAVKVGREWVEAATAIDLVPRISEDHANINLQVNIMVNEFLSNANNRITRLIQTNANVGNGEILAIGGLVRETESTEIRKVPILGDVPLIGWFFKREQKVVEENNLMVFICPRIIQPKKNAINNYTTSKLCHAENNLKEYLLFENLRDPITRWFFQPDIGYAEETVDAYIAEQHIPENYQEAAHTAVHAPLLAQNHIKEGLQPVDRSRIDQDLKEALATSENPLLACAQPTQQEILNTEQSVVLTDALAT
jgi:general secretion pathway protein D